MATLIKSIVRATQVLTSLSEGNSRITDISNSLNLNSASTHRVLKTLQEVGLVMQDPVSHRYCLGGLIIGLASNPIIAHQNLIICAFEEIKRLWKLSGETVVLDIIFGTQRVRLHQLQSNHPLKYVGELGATQPLYTGAIGKALLSELGENELELVLKNINLTPVTPNTITDKGVLIAALKKVKKQGYAVSSGEQMSGIMAISAPIRNYMYPVALSIVGPESRLEPNTLRLVEELRESTNRISQNLLDVNKVSLSSK